MPPAILKRNPVSCCNGKTKKAMCCMAFLVGRGLPFIYLSSSDLRPREDDDDFCRLFELPLEPELREELLLLPRPELLLRLPPVLLPDEPPFDFEFAIV
jgi:hypothetical protein